LIISLKIEVEEAKRITDVSKSDLEIRRIENLKLEGDIINLRKEYDGLKALSKKYKEFEESTSKLHEMLGK